MKTNDSKWHRPELEMSDTIRQIPMACRDETAAVEFLEKQRWGETPCCIHCGSVNVYKMTDAATGERSKRFLWRCRDCRRQYTVRIGTVYEESRIELRHWCYAFWRAATSKKGVAALEIMRQTGLSYKSALFLMNRIRFAMAPDLETTPKLTGIVEAEWDAGGKPGPDPTARNAAADWLAAELSDLAEHPVADLRRSADDAGLTWATVRRASSSIGVLYHRATFGGGYIWRLPRPGSDPADDPADDDPRLAAHHAAHVPKKGELEQHAQQGKKQAFSDDSGGVNHLAAQVIYLAQQGANGQSGDTADGRQTVCPGERANSRVLIFGDTQQTPGGTDSSTLAPAAAAVRDAQGRFH